MVEQKKDSKPNTVSGVWEQTESGGKSCDGALRAAQEFAAIAGNIK